MNEKFTLTSIITLLYIETLIPSDMSSSKEIIAHALTHFNRQDEMSESYHSGDPIAELNELASYMLHNKTGAYNLTEFIQRISMTITDDEVTKKCLIDGLKELPDDQDKLRELSITYRGNVTEFINYNTIQRKVDQARRAIRKADPTTAKDIARELMADLEADTAVGVDSEHPSYIDGVDYSDPASIEDKFTEADIDNTVGGFITGWRDFNASLGVIGKLRLGDVCLIAGLQHHFKSGLTWSLFRQIVQLNNPAPVKSEGKKPLALGISVENHTKDNNQWLYRNIYENEHKQPADLFNFDKHKAAELCSKALSVNGWTCVIRAYSPIGFTVQDAIDVVHKYEALGYDVQVTMIDYPMVMDKLDHKSSTIYREWLMLKSLAKSNRTLLVAPHQLGPEAKDLNSMGADGLGDNSFVNMVSGKGWLEYCKGLLNHVDVDFTIHIEQHNDQWFLAWRRGKHRQPFMEIPLSKRMGMIPFHPCGSLIDDINDDEWYDESHRIAQRCMNSF